MLIALAFAFSIATKTFRQYLDDSYAQFEGRNFATEFLNNCHSQHQHIQNTTEYENVTELFECNS